MKFCYQKSVENDKYIDDIANNEKINFIGFATTPWHVHGLMASIYKIIENGERLNGKIYIMPHAQTGYAIDESFFPRIDGIKIERAYKNRSIRDKILNVCYSISYLLRNKKQQQLLRNIYIVEPWTVNSALSGAICKRIKDIQLTHVVYDEGVSTYFPIKYKSSNISSFVYNQYLKYIVFGRGLKYLSSRPNFILAKLFDETNKGLIENHSIIPFYLKALSNSPKRMPDSIEFDENSVIICTTAWDRTEIKDKEDVKLIQALATTLKDMGYKIWFKPHPRDKQFNDLYPHVDKIKSDLSIETILLNAKKKPLAMISISSTILVTSKLFFGIKTFDISRMLNNAYIGRYIDEVSSFQTVFGDYVTEPVNIDELRVLISEK